MHALSFEDRSEEAAQFAAKQKLRALDAFDKLTGGFLRNASTSGEFESRLRYVTEELEIIAESDYDGDVDGLREAMIVSWSPKEADVPEAFKEQWKGGDGEKKDDKPKDGPPKDDDGPPKPKSDDGPPKEESDDSEGDDDSEPLGSRTITTDEAIPADTELVITLDVAEPKESSIDWERFRSLEADQARDFACAYVLSKKPRPDDPALVYMTHVIGAKDGFMPHLVHEDILRTTATVRSAFMQPDPNSDWYEAGRIAGETADADDTEPFSNERIGGSIPDIFGTDRPTDDQFDDYAQGYADGRTAMWGDDPSAGQRCNKCGRTAAEGECTAPASNGVHDLTAAQVQPGVPDLSDSNNVTRW